MKITLHIGVPKTGSTAIQAHLGLNRDWFAARRVALPATGFSEGYGHVQLFEDVSDTHLSQLRDELVHLQDKGFDHAVLSWEGLNTFNREQLHNIRKFLDGHEVEVLAYLREQSEVVQSGYLQAIKQRPQKRTLSDFSRVERMLVPRHIDYSVLLRRYAEIFGHDAVRARVYERALLVEGNAVIDFIDALGLTVDQSFILAPDRQNISLDVGSASLLNTLDSVMSGATDRENLVDLLLCQVNTAGPDHKYFLSEAQVSFIHDHFQASNDDVLQQFVEQSLSRDTLFDTKKITHCLDVEAAGLAAAKLGFLASMSAFRSWRGEPLEAAALQTLVSPVEGWSTPESIGIWSRDAVSTLRFRVQPGRISPHSRKIRLRLEGEYFHQNRTTELRVQGAEPVVLALDEQSIDVPLETLDEFGRCEIHLRHEAPVSPRSIGMNNDERKLAFLLRRAHYEIV